MNKYQTAYFTEVFPDEDLYEANHNGWVPVKCPFHNDSKASAAINIDSAWFNCLSGECTGEKGLSFYAFKDKCYRDLGLRIVIKQTDLDAQVEKEVPLRYYSPWKGIKHGINMCQWVEGIKTGVLYKIYSIELKQWVIYPEDSFMIQAYSKFAFKQHKLGRNDSWIDSTEWMEYHTQWTEGDRND